MPTIALNDIYQLKVGCYTPDQAGINVTYWKCASVTGSSATDTAFAQDVDADINANYKTLLENGAHYYGVRVQRVFPTPLTLAVVVNANDGAGSAGALPMPAQASPVITIRTANAGRAFRGRIFIPFPASTALDATTGFVTAGTITALNNLVSVFLIPQIVGAGANTATMVPVIYHRFAGSNTPAVSAAASGKFGNQRRRGNYGRLNPYPPF